MTEPKREDEAYIRIGDTAVLLTWKGEGRQRKLMAHIVREIPPAVLKINPEAADTWTLEELVALKTIIRKAENHAISMQSTNIRVQNAVAAAQAEREEREKLRDEEGDDE